MASLFAALSFTLSVFANLSKTKPVATGSAAKCASLKLNIPNVHLSASTHFPENATLALTTPQSSLMTSTLPAFCRVQLVITTNATAGSTALAEVWLPDAWNGRSLGVGNGGASGGINVGDLGLIAVNRGFAGMSTDTGHEGNFTDMSFAGPGDDNAIFDWGSRAFRETIVNGKAIIEQYYRHSINKSYYLGCSSGGRQGLKEVQEFPEDFDGVVRVVYTFSLSHLQPWSLHMNLLVQPETSDRFIPANLWTDVIAPEVLNQCDHLDGLSDGIIADPRTCSFRPETLTCRPGQNASTCLTGTQVFTLKHIYANYFEANQTFIFNSYYPGGELGFFNGLVGNAPFELGIEWIQFLVLNDTSFGLFDFSPDILRLGDEINPGGANAINPNISGFAGPSHNGKLIHYVGWADQLISPGNSVHYYETVHTFMNEHTNMNIDDFYRLFPGGTGATSFGAAGDTQPALANDAQHNILDAIVRWVEDGVAPGNFTAAHFTNGVAADGVAFTRPICQYPLSVRFVGGNPDDASSFECALAT
ncbi:feruloyl esterase-like protein [Epithele typhae]|uniref:feruloyl esterase-like protein n=1 Tax=Epithele typhae TaxID=378194 RepID=UPI002007BAA4|nr:feruloyl esterase-like protein [Epithele typhae]KAH9917129.1 feruloyl esterase-like protein [Epithele typhae]